MSCLPTIIDNSMVRVFDTTKSLGRVGEVCTCSYTCQHHHFVRCWLVINVQHFEYNPSNCLITKIMTSNHADFIILYHACNVRNSLGLKNCQHKTLGLHGQLLRPLAGMKCLINMYNLIMHNNIMLKLSTVNA